MIEIAVDSFNALQVNVDALPFQPARICMGAGGESKTVLHPCNFLLSASSMIDWNNARAIPSSHRFSDPHSTLRFSKPCRFLQSSGLFRHGRVPARFNY